MIRIGSVSHIEKMELIKGDAKKTIPKIFKTKSSINNCVVVS